MNKCRRCKLPALVGVLCPKHKEEARLYAMARARRLGVKAWRGRGRPPKRISDAAQMETTKTAMEYKWSVDAVKLARMALAAAMRHERRSKIALNNSYSEALGSIIRYEPPQKPPKPLKLRKIKFGKLSQVWPFNGTDGSGESLITQINDWVPRGTFPEDVRQEVCQELALRMLVDNVPISKALYQECLESVRRAYPIGSGRWYSFDDHLKGTDDITRGHSMGIY